MGLKITVKDSVEAFGLKMEIDRHGLRPGAGYTWRYTPADYFGDIADDPDVNIVEFEFDNDKWATCFQLKWAK